MHEYISLGSGLLLAAGGFLGGQLFKRRLAAVEAPTRRQRFPSLLCSLLAMAGGWWFLVRGIALLFPEVARGKREFEVDIFPRRMEILGHEINETVLITWGIIAAVLLLALAFRLFVVPRMQEKPKGLQLLLETLIENLDKYIGSKVHGMGVSFGAYIFSLALLMIASAFTELLGLRGPTTDVTMTLALGLISFFLINWYGFRRRGFLGRLKALSNPFLLLSEMVIPVSMACRLFGNMFGGMIIIDLIYFIMKNAAVALPSVVGVYFNVIHPLLQAFIFITLTLSYIADASEVEEA